MGKSNPILARALETLDAAVNQSADAMKVQGRIDDGHHATNMECVKEAMRLVSSLAVAAALGFEIISETEDQFQEAIEEGRRKWSELVAERERLVQERIAAEEAANQVLPDDHELMNLPPAEGEPTPPSDDGFGPIVPEPPEALQGVSPPNLDEDKTIESQQIKPPDGPTITPEEQPVQSPEDQEEAASDYQAPEEPPVEGGKKRKKS